MPDFLSGFNGQTQFNQQRALGDVQQTQGTIGILQAIQKQQQDAQVKGILSSDMPDDQKMQFLASGKGGLAGVLAAHQMMQVKEQQDKVAHATKERAFYSPENQAKFMIGGAPAQPAQAPITPNDDEGNAMPGVAAQPATPGKFDLNSFVNAGAAQGLVKPETLLNHQMQNQTRQDALQARLADIQTRSADKALDRQGREDLAKQAQEARRDLYEFMKANRQGPQPHYITNADGVFQVGRDSQATPVKGPDGEPLSGKTQADKAIPSPIAKAFTENANSLRKIDTALAEVDKTPNAFGLKNMLGDTVNQRLDPTGVTARAIVADIGSLKIHDRSGAAVTAAETPRLLPFIPNVNDKPETIKKKLGLFRKEYQNIQNDLSNIYSPEQGYRAFPGAATPAAKPAPDPLGIR